MHCAASTVLALAAVTSFVLAADHPLGGGDRLRLTDPANAAGRRMRFRALRDPALDPGVTPDPHVAGATLEIAGGAPGDGSTGRISLDPALWTRLGRPRGSRGYRYLDRNPANGVTKATIRFGRRGGTLSVTGGGPSWPYRVTQPQGPIDVRFALGDEVYCARFADFVRNEAGLVVARDAAPPAACGTGASCGNGLAEGSEECDDGNTTDGDGCSARCELEDASAVCAGVPAVAGTALDAVRVASRLTHPVHVAAPRLDPNRLFVVEQPGRIRIVKNGALLPAPFLAIEGKVRSSGEEQGLLSVAFHPDFEANGLFFVDYTRRPDGATVIARYRVSANPDLADAESEHILLAIPQPFANHNGGLGVFGPDGHLYVGMGDGGGRGDPLENAQDDATRLGKLLRIDVDAESVMTWAKGLRNPWRFSFDRATGDLYIADVGQDDWEEVDYQPAPAESGVNYGWDVLEGRHCFDPPPLFADCRSVPSGFSTLPVLEYCHPETGDPACGAHPRGCSITGGFVYRGCRMPDLRGTYFYSDFCAAFVRTFRGVSGGTAQELADRTADVAPRGGLSIDRVSSFGEDARGELYIVDYGTGARDGEIFALVPGR